MRYYRIFITERFETAKWSWGEI